MYNLRRERSGLRLGHGGQSRAASPVLAPHIWRRCGGGIPAGRITSRGTRNSTARAFCGRAVFRSPRPSEDLSSANRTSFRSSYSFPVCSSACRLEGAVSVKATAPILSAASAASCLHKLSTAGIHSGTGWRCEILPDDLPWQREDTARPHPYRPPPPD